MSDDITSCPYCGARRIGRSCICVKCEKILPDNRHDARDVGWGSREPFGCASCANPFCSGNCGTGGDSTVMASARLDGNANQLPSQGGADVPLHLKVLQGLGRGSANRQENTGEPTQPLGQHAAPHETAGLQTAAQAQPPRRQVAVVVTGVAGLQDDESGDEASEGGGAAAEAHGVELHAGRQQPFAAESGAGGALAARPEPAGGGAAARPEPSEKPRRSPSRERDAGGHAAPPASRAPALVPLAAQPAEWTSFASSGTDDKASPDHRSRSGDAPRQGPEGSHAPAAAVDAAPADGAASAAADSGPASVLRSRCAREEPPARAPPPPPPPLAAAPPSGERERRAPTPPPKRPPVLPPDFLEVSGPERAPAGGGSPSRPAPCLDEEAGAGAGGARERRASRAVVTREQLMAIGVTDEAELCALLAEGEAETARVMRAQGHGRGTGGGQGEERQTVPGAWSAQGPLVPPSPEAPQLPPAAAPAAPPACAVAAAATAPPPAPAPAGEAGGSARGRRVATREQLMAIGVTDEAELRALLAEEEAPGPPPAAPAAPTAAALSPDPGAAGAAPGGAAAGAPALVAALAAIGVVDPAEQAEILGLDLRDSQEAGRPQLDASHDPFAAGTGNAPMGAAGAGAGAGVGSHVPRWKRLLGLAPIVPRAVAEPAPARAGAPPLTGVPSSPLEPNAADPAESRNPPVCGGDEHRGGEDVGSPAAAQAPAAAQGFTSATVNLKKVPRPHRLLRDSLRIKPSPQGIRYVRKPPPLSEILQTFVLDDTDSDSSCLTPTRQPPSTTSPPLNPPHRQIIACGSFKNAYHGKMGDEAGPRPAPLRLASARAIHRCTLPAAALRGRAYQHLTLSGPPWTP